MAKRTKKQSFAEVMQALEEPRAEEPLVPGLTGDTLIDNDGIVLRVVREELTPTEARQVAEGGARLVWDSCGCGGGCEIVWFSTKDVTALAATGEPKIHRKRYWEHISEMRADDDSRVLLVSGDVTWADRLG